MKNNLFFEEISRANHSIFEGEPDMSVEELRNVLLRVVLDGEFSHLLRTNPEEALKDYTLTDDEKAMLTNPTIDLLDKVRPAFVLPPIKLPVFLPITLAFPAATAMTEADKEKLAQLVRDIRNSVGRERFDMIMDLVRQIQPEDQTHNEPPEHE
jgi:hypothetical protein